MSSLGPDSNDIGEICRSKGLKLNKVFTIIGGTKNVVNKQICGGSYRIVMSMEPKKLSFLKKEEYDELIENQYICRISYQGENYPQIKPFLYVFDGSYIYILATKYGKKLKYLKENPSVAVEIEDYSKDLSYYKFVTLSGRLEKVVDRETKEEARRRFVDLIKSKNLSRNIMTALGYFEDEPVEAIAKEERNILFKLVGVKNITGFKSEE